MERVMGKEARDLDGEQLAAMIAEAQGIRGRLEGLEARGAFDLRNKEHRDAHQRLDKLEALIHRARTRPRRAGES
jgi:hypothetical protein